MLRLGHLCPPPALAPTATLATLPRHVLTRHAVCLGVTGSGKTGMCLSLLEELALAGVPLLAIDPKGDLTNLALLFPELRPEDFALWLDVPGDDPARRDRLAVETAAAWRAGLAAAGLGPADLQAFRDRVEVIVMTPGSEAGVPVDVLSALTRAPAGLADDPEGLREFVTGAVDALLGLVGRRADPLTDPASILLARLLGDAFAAGRDLPFDVLLPAIVDPPFDRLGLFPLDDFLPPEDRTALALQLDAVLASPAFAAWRRGVPLDLDAWTAPRPDGRVPLRVLYLAHLDDAQRMFFVTLLLHAVVAWTRRLPGTSALRSLLYFDEVVGYLPPHPKDPPSKAPLLTLLKQARSVGLGVMLATQNPVDLDYKALSNAETWLLGRLPTRQDRARVLQGLPGDTTDLDALVAGLPARTFVVRRAGRETEVVHSRHTLSFLRGPLTRHEVARLGQGGAWAVEAASRWLRAPPPSPGGVPVRYLRPDVAAGHAAPVGDDLPPGAVPLRPALLTRVHVRFDEEGWAADRVLERLWFPLDRADVAPREVRLAPAHLLDRPPEGAVFERLPGWVDRGPELQAWLGRLLAATLRDARASRACQPALGVLLLPGEDREAFEARVRALGGDEAVAGIVDVPVAPEREDVRLEDVALVWVPVG